MIDCGLADPARAMLAGVGLLLVADPTNHRVMAFDPLDGDLVDANFIPPDAVNLPNPVAAIVGPDHSSILVSDADLNVVQRFDFNGVFLGRFAPAAGADPARMESPFGIALRPNGNLLVCARTGGNAESVQEYDTAGNRVGHFIAPGSGGLVDPFDIRFRANGNVLVGGTSSGHVHQYDANGAYLGNVDPFTAGMAAPAQVIEAANGNLLVALTVASPGTHERGVVEYQPDGTRVSRMAPPSVAAFDGVYALGNGNLLIATLFSTRTGGALTDTPGGVHEIDRAGNIVEAKIARMPIAGPIKFALQDSDGDGVGDSLDGCPADPAKTAPGLCGCGVSDVNSDGDAAPDCLDGCPGDPAKIVPGICGYGVADADSDGDGIPDGVDVCPGANDLTDANANGQLDCLEPPPAPQTSACGCGAGLPPIMVLSVPMYWLASRRLRRGWRRRR